MQACKLQPYKPSLHPRDIDIDYLTLWYTFSQILVLRYTITLMD